MMIDDHDSDGPTTMPPHHVLEAFTVPTLPSDFTDRVMASLQPPGANPVMTAAALQSPRASWPWLVSGLAMGAAATAAVTLLVLHLHAPAPTTHEPVVLAPVPGEPLAPVVAVSPAPKFGHLVITCEPGDAIVRVDGRTIPGTSPVVVTNLVPGPHDVVVEREGHTGWSQRIDVPADVLPLTLRLPEIAAPDLDAFMPPPDDAAAAPAKAVRPRPKKSGPRSLRDIFGASDSGGSPDLKDPFARSDEPERTLSVRASDQDEPASADVLLLLATDAGTRPAEVFVDGAAMGTTPLSTRAIPPGRHDIRFRWDDGTSVADSVVLRAGTKVVLRAR